MTERVRVGVIGTSWFADMLHLPCLKSHPQCELVAICGRNEERASEMASKYGVAQVFTEYDAMIETAGLDAAVIVTPDDLHRQMAIAALDAGLHVLCEKPLALTVADAQEMCSRAQAAGVKHMVFFTNRWTPHYRYVHELIEKGYIGDCYHAELAYMGGGNRNAESYAWRYDSRRANGVLGDLGSHLIDMATWLIGDIRSVRAQLAVHAERPGTDGIEPANDSALLLTEFENGAQGTFQISNVACLGAKGQEHRVVFHGSQGSLTLNFTFEALEITGIQDGESHPRTLAIPPEYWGPVDQTQPMLDRLIDVLKTQSVGDRLFIDAILRDVPLAPTFEDGLRVQQVIEAATLSSESGEKVLLS